MTASDTITLSFPARIEYLGLVEACLTTLLSRESGLADPTGTTFEVVLAVHETATNIIAHAYGEQSGQIDMSLALLDGPRRLVVRLHDSGRAFELPAIEPPNQNGSVQTSGYGLFLIHRLMDEVTYFPEAGNNRWVMVKKLT
jgi:anti-sigma regulatory factor (Ser/Thr protein kinase)